MWRLVGVQGPFNGRFFNLEKDSIILGKGSDCLDEDPSVAEVQAELLLCNGSYVFKNLDNAYATMINGTVPAGMVTLCHNDLLQMGESVFRIEQTKAPVHTNITGTKPNAVIEQSTIPWKIVAVITLAILVTAGIAIPNILRAKELRALEVRRAIERKAQRTKCSQMAQEVVASLQSIGSALKVGLSYDEYSKKVIDSQTKIDSYITKFGEKELGGVGKQMQEIQLAYVDAKDVWNFKIQSKNGDFLDRSNYDLDSETMDTTRELIDTCLTKYPEVDKRLEDGGAASKSAYDGTYHCYYTEVVMQIIWNHASDEVSTLKISDSNQHGMDIK